MNIYDMHIHIWSRTTYVEKPDPAVTLERMAQAGVSGGCLFSNPPKEANPELGTDFEPRLTEVIRWTANSDNRLFPVLWIHPNEKDIVAKLDTAIAAGVVGFKIICTDFFVGDPKSLALLREIAKRGKPVFFHSGILWDNRVASIYNRPLNWEPLLEIDGLRFSMGHCAWPWIDECIALYGEFRYAPIRENGAEMFLDITRGTPAIYRKELFEKLYTIGWDIEKNILFGTDNSADHYSFNYANEQIAADLAIMDEIGVSEENRERLYHGNPKRFLGFDF